MVARPSCRLGGRGGSVGAAVVLVWSLGGVVAGGGVEPRGAAAGSASRPLRRSGSEGWRLVRVAGPGARVAAAVRPVASPVRLADASGRGEVLGRCVEARPGPVGVAGGVRPVEDARFALTQGEAELVLGAVVARADGPEVAVAGGAGRVGVAATGGGLGVPGFGVVQVAARRGDRAAGAGAARVAVPDVGRQRGGRPVRGAPDVQDGAGEVVGHEPLPGAAEGEGAGGRGVDRAVPRQVRGLLVL